MAGAGLRLARQARGFSQQQLAGMAGVSRQAVSAVEAGHSDPSLRVALALAQALGMSVEELFGPGEPVAPVRAISIAPLAAPAAGDRVTLALVGDRFIALPLRGDTGAGLGFLPAGGLAAPGALGATAAIRVPAPAAGNGSHSADRSAADRSAAATESIAVRPLGPPRPTLVVAGCDPALPLLATPLSLLDPPVAFAWWPCGSGEALRLARAGLVHAAGVHAAGANGKTDDGRLDNGIGRAAIPDGAELIGFTAWREGLAIRPALASTVRSLAAIASNGLRIVNREPGAEARRLLDAECRRQRIEPEDLAGYDTQAAGHLQVASAVAAGLADAGIASEPAVRAYGLHFVPLASEYFNLIIPPEHTAAREVQALRKVLASPWLHAQLASLPGYNAATCGDRR